MIEQITSYLKAKAWNYTENRERESIHFSLTGRNGVFQCLALAEGDAKRLGFYSYCPATCPADVLIKMAELLMRLNASVFFGNFELNFETGVILYKTGLFTEGIDLSYPVLDNIIIRNVAVLDDCTPILLKLMYGNLSAVEAFQLRFGEQAKLEG